MLESLFFLLLLSFAVVTAASETSIIAASRIKLKRLASEGSKLARIVLKILETPEKFFGTILVANNIVDALIAVLITAVMIRLAGGEEKWVIVAATLLASFMIIVSEVAAKTFAANNAERLALLFARPVKLLILLFSPVVRVLAVITNFIVKILGGKPTGKASLVTDEEIKSLIKFGEEESVSHKEKYKMLSRVFAFSDALVKNVMMPKKDIVSIDITSPLDSILDKVMESGYSRIPVYKDSQDNIIGIINMKDLLRLSTNRDLIVLQDIIYPATFVENSRKVADLLKEFQNGHTHLAVVVDPKKNIEGIITLEDLLEEIVGEIEDEYDLRAK